MAITHEKVSAKADSPDTSLVRPSDWNEDHTGSAETLRETGGPTDLPIGAIAAGEFLQRVGATIVGGAAAAGNPTSLDVVTTDITVVNTVVETTIYSFLVPANTLSTNNLLRLRLWLCLYNASGAPRSNTMKVKYGATTMITAINSPYMVDGYGPKPVDLALYLKGDTATNAQRAMVGAGYDSEGANLRIFGLEGTAVEDSTGALTLEVTMTLAAAHANLSVIRRAATLELMAAL